MYCHHCSVKLPGDSKFCKWCGEELLAIAQKDKHSVEIYDEAGDDELKEEIE